MLTQETMSLTPFFEKLEAQFKAACENDPADVSSRQKAWDHFKSLGLPTKKNEAFQYIPLRYLYDSSYVFPKDEAKISEEWLSSLIYPECQGSVLVFVNGVFRKEYSQLEALPKSVVVLPLMQALKSGYASFLQHRMRQRLADEKDPLVALNTALYSSGIFVFVPPKTQVETPIQCLYINTEQTASFPRIHVSLGAHAKVEWISSLASFQEEASFWYNGVMDVALDESSSFNHLLLMQSPKDVWGFHAFRATLKRDSRLHCKNFTTGSKTLRQDYHVSLLGENSEATLQGLSWLSENNQSHLHVVVDHVAPNCLSNQFFKGVLSDVSQSSFTGKILVRQKAQKTQAYQLNNNLLLTEGTLANSKPGLEIFADDVKASHGATFSQIDEDQLFYLKTRGLSEEAAKTLLVLGFCKDLLDSIAYDSIREEAIESIKHYLRKQRPS